MITTSQSTRRSDAAENSTIGLVFEVRSGRTRYPHRPVGNRRFLIGSGSMCDLQLGGPDIPPLHCLVCREDGEFRLESVAASPELRVNGEVVSSVLLSDGDVVGIDRLEFVAHFATPGMITSHVSAASTEVPNVITEDEFDVSCLQELSAESLVDLIEQEQTAVDEFDARTELGGNALLYTALRRAEQIELTETDFELESNSEDVLLRRLEKTIARLSRYANAVETRKEPEDDVLAQRLQSLAYRVDDSEGQKSSSPRSAA